MSIADEARQLDREAAEIATRTGADFIRLGIIMHKMSEYERWRTLKDPRTGAWFHSLEAWVNLRFRAQRATAFAARTIYRRLMGKVPDEVMAAAEPGSLRMMAALPESAQKDPAMHSLISTATTGEFTREALARYPEELIERTVRWALKPTVSQADLYNRVLERVQMFYGENGSLVSREDALEMLLVECEQQMDAKGQMEAVCQ